MIHRKIPNYNKNCKKQCWEEGWRELHSSLSSWRVDRFCLEVAAQTRCPQRVQQPWEEIRKEADREGCPSRGAGEGQGRGELHFPFHTLLYI